MIPTFALAGLLWQAAAEPEYLLGKLRFPAVTEPGEPFKLADLRYRLADDGPTLHSAEFRLKWNHTAYLGGEVTGDRRGFFVDTQRLELGLSEENGELRLEGNLRAPRLRLAARGELRPDEGGRLARLEAGFRWSPDLELTARWLEDSGPVTSFSSRLEREGGLGLLYQRGSYLDLEAGFSRSQLSSPTEQRSERDQWSLATTLYRSAFELSADWRSRWRRGFLPNDEHRVALSGRLPLGSHLVFEASTANRWEPGVKSFERESRLGLVFFGKAHRLVRERESTERVLALTRRAYELGYNERRVYDLDGIRALRERLALSRRRDELAVELDELYRAQVRDRNVEGAGFDTLRAIDDVAGTRKNTLHFFLALPWPKAWSFSRSEALVDFFRFDVTREELLFAAQGRALTTILSATISLNRENQLRLDWQKPGRTALDIARQITRPNRFELSYEYAFGR